MSGVRLFNQALISKRQSTSLDIRGLANAVQAKDPAMAAALVRIQESVNLLEKRLRAFETGVQPELAIIGRTGIPLGWIGSNPPYYGAWLKQLYVGGTSPADAPLIADANGNLTIDGSVLITGTVTAAAFNIAAPFVESLTLTNNSPGAGRIAWSNCIVYYLGTAYSITGSNTPGTERFVYWDTGNTTFTAANSFTPQVGRFLIATNDSGTADVAWSKMARAGIQTANILDDAITTDKVAASAITATEIASSAVTTDKLNALAVTTAKIAANAVTATEISSNAVTTDKLNALAVTTAKIAASAVTATEIAANAVTTAKLDALSVTTAKIAAGAVTATEIGASAVTTDKLNALAVTTAKLAANAVTANEIAANAVTTDKLNALAVTTAKIAALAVTASEIAAGAITTTKIAAGAVTANEIAANAVTADKVNAAAITATKLNIKQIIVTSLTLTNNSPSAGSIAWSACTVFHDGSSYSITGSNTASTFVYWDAGNTTFTGAASYTPQTNRFLIATNNSGTATEAWNTLAPKAIQEANLAFTIPGGYHPQATANASIDLLNLGDTIVLNESARGFLLLIGIYTAEALDGSPIVDLKWQVDGGAEKTLRLYNGLQWDNNLQILGINSSGDGLSVGNFITLQFGIPYDVSLVVKVNVGTAVSTTGELHIRLWRALRV